MSPMTVSAAEARSTRSPDKITPMDTWDGSTLIPLLLGGIVAALVLYGIIRLAVRHGIRDTHRQTDTK